MPSGRALETPIEMQWGNAMLGPHRVHRGENGCLRPSQGR